MIDRALEEQESSQRAWITYWGSGDRSGKASASLRLTVERRYIGRGDKINFQVGSPREITKYDLKAEKLKCIQWPCYATQNKKKLLCKTDRTEWRSLIHSGLCTGKKRRGSVKCRLSTSLCVTDCYVVIFLGRPQRHVVHIVLSSSHAYTHLDLHPVTHIAAQLTHIFGSRCLQPSPTLL